MFGSQALDTAIGLVLMFFIIATAASAITEVINQFITRRARYLEQAIGAILVSPGGADANNQLNRFKGTTVWKAISNESPPRFLKWLESTLPWLNFGPSYLSAKAFADAAVELVLADDGDNVLTQMPNLQGRLQALVLEGRDTILEVKSGLESWFDESMDRLEGRFKRWTTLIVFVVGLVLSVAFNASATSVAHDLWNDTVTRDAVAAAAGNMADASAQPDKLDSIAKVMDTMTQLSLPIGWHPGEWGQVWGGFPGSLVRVFGWVLTALFVMLGAPFWFELLTKLVPLRVNGTKPQQAVNDDASATKVLAQGTPTEGGQLPPAPARDVDQTAREKLRGAIDGSKVALDQKEFHSRIKKMSPEELDTAISDHRSKLDELNGEQQNRGIQRA